MILRLASTDAKLILVVAMPAAADRPSPRHPTDAGHHLCLRRTWLASRPGEDGEERGREKKRLASNMWDPRGSRAFST